MAERETNQAPHTRIPASVATSLLDMTAHDRRQQLELAAARVDEEFARKTFAEAGSAGMARARSRGWTTEGSTDTSNFGAGGLERAKRKGWISEDK